MSLSALSVLLLERLLVGGSWAQHAHSHRHHHEETIRYNGADYSSVTGHPVKELEHHLHGYGSDGLTSKWDIWTILTLVWMSKTVAEFLNGRLYRQRNTGREEKRSQETGRPPDEKTDRRPYRTLVSTFVQLATSYTFIHSLRSFGSVACASLSLLVRVAFGLARPGRPTFRLFPTIVFAMALIATVSFRPEQSGMSDIIVLVSHLLLIGAAGVADRSHGASNFETSGSSIVTAAIAFAAAFFSGSLHHHFMDVLGLLAVCGLAAILLTSSRPAPMRCLLGLDPTRRPQAPASKVGVTILILKGILWNQFSGYGDIGAISAALLIFASEPDDHTRSKGGHHNNIIISTLHDVYKHVASTNESRRIFGFLLLNLSYMIIQVIWGMWTNSLGLISDAIHMAFDCLSLGVGLLASVMSTWPADGRYSFGYVRVQALSGFVNGVFLVLVSLFIMVEAIQRVINPPPIENTMQLLIVSTGGLLVNIGGLLATGGDHHHDHGHAGHDHHDHDHAHDHHHHHDGRAEGQAHKQHDHHSGHHHGHGHGHSHNMRGVFLDTLGSAGVIVSTLLIKYTGWSVFDPIASLFMAIMIVVSVVPLLQDTAKVLCLELDTDRAKEVENALAELSSLESVDSIAAPRFWPKNEKSLVGSLHFRIRSSLPGDTDPELLSATMHEVEGVLKRRIPDLSELVVQFEHQGSNYCRCTMTF